MANSRLCSIPDCGKPHKGRGYCKNHLDRVNRNGHPDLLKPPIEFCTIEGCGKPHASRGYCSTHYSNLRRHGHPEKLISTPKGAPAKYLGRMIEENSWADECALWPYGRNNHGYGYLYWQGRRTYAHRLVCEIAHGTPPSAHHQASHNCGNGHLGCFNPRHLRWDTHRGNHTDRRAHGTLIVGENVHGAKLGAEDVIAIRSGMFVGMTQSEIASRFSVSQRTVADILSGTTWKHLL